MKKTIHFAGTIFLIIILIYSAFSYAEGYREDIKNKVERKEAFLSSLLAFIITFFMCAVYLAALWMD